MACSHPLKAWVMDYDSNGKKVLLWQSKRFDFKPPSQYIEALEIPCGQCVSCRLQYSRMWADRCMMELEDHDSAYFVTLTYSDEYINSDRSEVKKYYSDESTGEAKMSLSLIKSDLQKFFKRLRQLCPEDHIRYYACGEYGDRTLRPHYHCIIFGLHLTDLKYYKTSGLKDVYYNSDVVSLAWSDAGKNGRDRRIPIGYAVIGAVTWETCAYTARYVLKKAKGKTADSYKKFNMEPEFVVMSRKPAIGASFMQRHSQDFIDFGEVYLSTDRGSQTARAPRYFNQRLQESDPELYAELRARRMAAGVAATENKLQLTDLCIEDLREVEENALIMRSKALKREL